MQTYEIIYKKRNGQELTPDEIAFIVDGYTQEKIPDYQISAFLMAVWFNKMTAKERSQLTLSMLNSGTKLDLGTIPGIKVDKHSTGGVGDGTSLAIAPIVAAAGGIVPMMVGRGLGHTGGTLDKLEAIPGYNVILDHETIKRNLEKIGVVIIGQTNDIAPADKKMYALRDVTATVESIDLISASIMSKKLAEGMDALVLDVKTGKGAFMQKLDDSIDLAKSMVEIGTSLGKDMFAYITDMNQPLGNVVGHSLEIMQIIEILKGKGPKDIVELIILFSARMLVMAKLAKTMKEGRTICQKMIDSGKALEKFAKIIESQYGNPRVIDDYTLLLNISIKEEFLSPANGYISEMNALLIGQSAVLLGAGRETMDSKIDYGVGFILHKKLGDKVNKGEPILTIYANNRVKLESAKAKLKTAIQVSNRKGKIPPLVYGYVRKGGFRKEVMKRD